MLESSIARIHCPANCPGDVGLTCHARIRLCFSPRTTLYIHCIVSPLITKMIFVLQFLLPQAEDYEDD